MVTCTRCTARFSASPEIEAAWMEMHAQRFHGQVRATAHPRVEPVNYRNRRRPAGRAERPRTAA
ncbi:MAG: hypothetical protein ACM3S1_01040 [Hyphomicrobiales bacterium]